MWPGWEEQITYFSSIIQLSMVASISASLDYLLSTWWTWWSILQFFHASKVKEYLFIPPLYCSMKSSRENFQMRTWWRDNSHACVVRSSWFVSTIWMVPMLAVIHRLFACLEGSGLMNGPTPTSQWLDRVLVQFIFHGRLFANLHHIIILTQVVMLLRTRWLGCLGAKLFAILIIQL